MALVARLVLGVAPGRRGCWRGRRGTWRHPSSFHVAGVVLGDIDFYSGVAGVALMALAGSGGALGFRCGAGTPRLLAWQAWHLETSIFVSRGRRATSLLRGSCGAYGSWRGDIHLRVAPGCRGCWRGRRGTWRHPFSFHVAGVVLGDIDFLLWRGRHGTYGTGLALVARLVLGVSPGRRGCWRGRRARHLETSIFVSRGRRATSTLAWQLWHVRQLAWQAWHLEISTFVSLGWRGTW